MVTIPKIIHHVYMGTVPPEMDRFMMTAMEVNPTWIRMLWTVDNIHVLGLNYADLIERFKAPVHVSDFVRLVAVQQFGGVYLDSDVEVIRPLTPLCDFEAVGAFQDGTGQICPAVFGASPHHPWIIWQVRNAQKYSVPDSPWNVTLMTDAPRDGVTIVPTEWFYPWLWNTAKVERKIPDTTLCIHHWKGSWAPWVIRER